MGFLAWVGLVPLIIAIYEASPRQAFQYGYLFGLVSFGISWYWLYNALHTFGHIPPATSVIVLILLVVMMSLYTGAACGLARYFSLKTKVPFILWLPIFWVLSEFARNYTPFGGFPWSPLSMSQTGYLPLVQFADITGAYGISFLLVWINIWLASSRGARHLMRSQAPYEVITLLLVALVLGYGFYRLNTVEAQSAKAPYLKVGLIQPNIQQNEKWDETTFAKQRAIFSRLVAKVEENADLIIWPEASFTDNVWLTDDKLAPADIGLLTRRGERPYTLLGLNFVTVKNNRERYFNSAALLDSSGNILDKYHKKHLVPFGEYNPLQKWLPFIKPVAAIGDFEAGEAYYPLTLENFRIAPLIC
ncbi:MAG: apolipoprotein N-acyltransferase, partial [bacterium]|nr:apolipoprotein N-acyltransferase [bacterium]